MAECIEREAAIEAVKKERDYMGKFSFEEEPAWIVGFQQGITFALSDIATIPAADVRPVVRAYWKSVPHKRARVCSRCEADEPYKFADDDANVYNYCPNCGADMREKS